MWVCSESSGNERGDREDQNPSRICEILRRIQPNLMGELTLAMMNRRRSPIRRKTMALLVLGPCDSDRRDGNHSSRLLPLTSSLSSVSAATATSLGTAAVRRTQAATSSKPHITEGPSLLWTRVLPPWRCPPSPAKPRRRLLHRRRSPRPPLGSQGEGAPRTPNCSRCKPPEHCCRRLPKAALFGARHRSSPISIHRRVTTGKVCFVSLAAIRFCHRSVIHCAPPFSCRAPHQNHVVCVSRVAACVASIHWVWIIWTGQQGSSRFELSINREPPLWTWFTLDRPSFLTYWSVLYNSGILPRNDVIIPLFWCKK